MRQPYAARGETAFRWLFWVYCGLVFTFLIAPILASAIDAGELARRDPEALAQLLVRLTLSCLLAPPPGDLAETLSQLLVPALS